jgi:hypothetical protein
MAALADQSLPDATARANDQQRILRYQNELFKLEEEGQLPRVCVYLLITS